MENAPIFDFKTFSDEYLFAIVENNLLPTVSDKALLELVRRLYSVIEEQQKVIELLNKPVSAVSQKQNGRKRKAFYMGKGLIDDDYLIYLIDSGLYTFKQLEQELGAGKNQLRNRFNRAKKKLEKDSKHK